MRTRSERSRDKGQDAVLLGVLACSLSAPLYALTDEDASYRGVVKPSHRFGPGMGGWGAFAVVGRYGVLEVDDHAFPLFADLRVSASEAASWTAGLNWSLNGNLKLVLNCLHTHLEGGAASSADRDDGKAVFTRLQVAF